MSSITIEQILNNLVLVSLECSLWSGSKKLRPEDLGGVNLPPGKLASLGTKKVFDPESLKVFSNLKRRAERSLSEIGVRFGGSGYAIPEAKLDSVHATILQCEKEFAAAKEIFLVEYDSKLEAWLQENAEWEGIFRKAVESASSAYDKMRFGCTIFKIGEPVACSLPVQETLVKRVGGLYGQLMVEIEQAAKEALKIFYGRTEVRTEVTRRALSPINDIKTKLEGLMFLNPSEIGGLMMIINAALAAVPKSGPINGAVLAGLHSVLHQMAGIEGFVAAAAQIKEEEFLAAAAPPSIALAKTKSHVAPSPANEPVMAVEEDDQTETQEIEIVPELEEEDSGWCF